MKQAPSVTLDADLLYNRPVCQAQLREPRKLRLYPFLLLCVSPGRISSWPPELKVFTPLVCCNPGESPSVSIKGNICQLCFYYRSEDVSVLAVKTVTQCLVRQEAAVSRLACQVSPQQGAPSGELTLLSHIRLLRVKSQKVGFGSGSEALILWSNPVFLDFLDPSFFAFLPNSNPILPPPPPPCGASQLRESVSWVTFALSRWPCAHENKLPITHSVPCPPLVSGEFCSEMLPRK